LDVCISKGLKIKGFADLAYLADLFQGYQGEEKQKGASY
jgi:hypothetical protein